MKTQYIWIFISIFILIIIGLIIGISLCLVFKNKDNFTATNDPCTKPCGGGTRYRNVSCQDSSGATVDDKYCKEPKPDRSEKCNTSKCDWDTSDPWSACDPSTHTQTRKVICKNEDGVTVADFFCTPPKPSTTQSC